MATLSRSRERGTAFEAERDCGPLTPALSPSEGAREVVAALDRIWRSRKNQSAARRRNYKAVVPGGFDLELDGGFGVLDGLLARRSVGQAAGKLRHVHHVSIVLLAPPEDHLVAVGFHNSL